MRMRTFLNVHLLCCAMIVLDLIQLDVMLLPGVFSNLNIDPNLATWLFGLECLLQWYYATRWWSVWWHYPMHRPCSFHWLVQLVTVGLNVWIVYLQPQQIVLLTVVKLCISACILKIALPRNFCHFFRCCELF